MRMRLKKLTEEGVLVRIKGSFKLSDAFKSKMVKKHKRGEQGTVKKSRATMKKKNKK